MNYIATGIGGTQLSPVDPSRSRPAAAPIRSVCRQRGFGSVLGDVFQNAVSELDRRRPDRAIRSASNTAQANLARAKLQYQQAQAQMQEPRAAVVTLQVRDAARNVQTNQKRVASADRASRELQEKKLEAEEKKLAAGMSSTFLVLQAQRDLSLARTVEIQAISDYNKSLVDFDAVQHVPLNGGSGSLTTAGSGALQTGGIIRQ